MAFRIDGKRPAPRPRPEPLPMPAYWKISVRSQVWSYGIRWEYNLLTQDESLNGYGDAIYIGQKYHSGSNFMTREGAIGAAKDHAQTLLRQESNKKIPWEEVSEGS